ncbi:MarR family winged helix-turn-helix transcriptional regulator [Lactiplantibacillus mudanjiangensis]|uniref:HTH marR-type domain-containing protein n=1 Tax=Lactiplantibacillus mudanjiangensis TaxID=1296538 RepID=A0A660DZ85_9LACO|nr:MarR family winged helix-turn-helix transcriptional regulator [Lactiplantibacillus mudanjiangensis]VDG25527.1 hypothetical protein [Lactobacillus sp. CBA3605] [Lactiplantibacillus mudanjiangensis]VDG29139.1 hypothetical protein [Lactobacillus sp. CBA3605] [Lactiplantibacillus mudanjiangensis]VDG31659.1 hypothetical protein [Lactobacillus sp. CBA3605] [Lactiplantibacillus mudanjiangensis]
MRTNDLGKYVGVLHRRFQIVINRELTLPALNATNANFLLFISEHDRVTAKQIATTLAINKGLVSRELTRLDTAGYIDRTTDQQDHRTSWVQITPTGQAACTTINALMQQLWDQVLADSTQTAIDQTHTELAQWADRASELK